MPEPYRQQLPAIDLSIEQATDRTPDAKLFYVFYRGDEVGRHRRLQAAQEQFKQLRTDSGWTPPERVDDRTPAQKIADEREAVQASAFAEYWGNSHKYRGGGRPKRK